MRCTHETFLHRNKVYIMKINGVKQTNNIVGRYLVNYSTERVVIKTNLCFPFS